MESDSHESILTPAGELTLPLSPLAIWQSAYPSYTTGDELRLRAYAAEHDLPKGAYGGGYGSYWLGRAILRVVEAQQPLSLRIIKGLLDHWRERTTDDYNAYGSNSPAYERRRGRRAAEQAHASTAEHISPSPELYALWSAVLDQLAPAIDRAQFETWLRPTALLALDGDQAIIGTPNIFTKDRLSQEFAGAIVEVLSTVCGRRVAVEFVIDTRIGQMR